MLVHARSNDASPVHRGRLIREHVLCEGLAPPPPGLVIEPPPLDPTKSSRERYAAHSQEEPCASCHKRMDPIGFAFDHFDGIGRYRADDHGHPIDDHAEILLSSDVQGSYADRDAMIDALAGSAQVKRCYARSMFRFAYGLSEDTRGNCLLARQEEAFAASDGSFLSLISVLISADLLLKREASAEAPAEEYDAEDAGSSVPDVESPSAPEPSSELQTEVTVNNDWGAGYCRTYQLTNAGAAPLTWMLTLELEGTLNQHWESRSSGEAGSVTFSGVEHNAVLAAGASTQFGFCVTR